MSKILTAIVYGALLCAVQGCLPALAVERHAVVNVPPEVGDTYEKKQKRLEQVDKQLEALKREQRELQLMTFKLRYMEAQKD